MTADPPVLDDRRSVRERAGGRRGRTRHPRLVPAVLGVVVMVDQATKWWAWRHLPSALINPGGDQLVGPKVGTWYSSQLSGALLDLQGAVVLTLAVSVLIRVRRRLLAVPATIVTAGWSSNALDRLGLHFWTAPGSARGAVDFIPIHDRFCNLPIRGGVYNVADFFIIAGTAFFLGALLYALLAGRGRLRIRPRLALHRQRQSPLARPGIAVTAAALLTAVAVGAVHGNGVTRPEAERSRPGVTSGP